MLRAPSGEQCWKFINTRTEINLMILWYKIILTYIYFYILKKLNNITILLYNFDISDPSQTMLLVCIIFSESRSDFSYRTTKGYILLYLTSYSRYKLYEMWFTHRDALSARKWIVNCAPASYRRQRRSLTSDIERIYCGLHCTYCKLVFTRRQAREFARLYSVIFIFPRLPRKQKSLSDHLWN